MNEKVVDVQEWLELGGKLADLNEKKFYELLEAMRGIVEAQQVLAEFDWQLMFRARPSKRYRA